MRTASSLCARTATPRPSDAAAPNAARPFSKPRRVIDRRMEALFISVSFNGMD